MVLATLHPFKKYGDCGSAPEMSNCAYEMGAYPAPAPQAAGSTSALWRCGAVALDNFAHRGEQRPAIALSNPIIANAARNAITSALRDAYTEILTVSWRGGGRPAERRAEAIHDASDQLDSHPRRPSCRRGLAQRPAAILTGARLATSLKHLAQTSRNSRDHAHYATHLLESGVTVPTIQKLLGHQAMKTTMVYMHVTHASTERLQHTLDRLMADL